MSGIKYIGTTPNGEQFDGSQVEACGLTCLKCGWLGSKAMLKTIPYMPEDGLPIEGETEDVCPNCESPAWEPID